LHYRTLRWRTKTERGRKFILKRVGENFPNLGKEKGLEIQEAQFQRR